MEYIIDYGTGIKETVNGTLEDAKKTADDGAAYTQRDVKILDSTGSLIVTRHWVSVRFDPDLYEDGEDADIIGFGDFGYFDEWSEYEN